ncbi:MAG TPA: hypothetical protein VN578_02660 [Candidatus Binatia bacterium]|jgi:hypothetical protein|nr:hypothetical protein [Candidatus Binatia bacterium]
MESLKIHRRHGLQRDENGAWAFTEESLPYRPKEGFHQVFNEHAVRYLNSFDIVFRAAKSACEFEFVYTLLGVKGMKDMSWDPFETTRRTIPAMIKLYEKIEDFEMQRHLALWTYGHIVEASEPYERLANLIAVSQGERFKICQFPPDKKGRPQSPGEKIRKLDEMAKGAGMPSVADPLKEIWDRALRNSVFHADYGLHGNSVIIPSAFRTYTHDQIMQLINRALAYHHALVKLIEIYRETYERPTVIAVHPRFGHFPNEKATVVVREGAGAIGLKDAWTLDAIGRGHIPWFVGIVLYEESKQLSANHSINFFRADGKGEEAPVKVSQ